MAPTATESQATLTAEDANLDVVAIALKYAFGFSAFRGEQQVGIHFSFTAPLEIRPLSTF